MILLLGGTSDAIDLSRLLIKEGLPLIFSMATEIPVDLPESKLITVRRGCLDEAGMEALILNSGSIALLDATHPYAEEVTRNAIKVSRRLGIRYFRLTRDTVVPEGPDIIFADSHQDAATKALAAGGPILLTIGVRNISLYAWIQSETSVRLVVRALPNPESIKTLADNGIAPGDMILGQGPFSYEDNIRVIKEFGVRTVVTKDSGSRGGVEEKVRAAQSRGCKLIVVRRPDHEELESFSDAPEMVGAVKSYLTTTSSKREGATPVTRL
ncbi:MAG: precorrin-6A reductase [Desulfomonilaceae bacterium]|jgi:precorrin-6A/cobalt-precorrin-6A reductase